MKFYFPDFTGMSSFGGFCSPVTPVICILRLSTPHGEYSEAHWKYFLPVGADGVALQGGLG